MASPFMEPFQGTEHPVLLLTNNADEICFTQVPQFKGKKFINIENSFDEIQKEMKDTSNRSGNN